ncbi:MAG: gamma-glutamyltransferase [Phycisphaerae bacterium]|nr:gamma-glutamyltransferase [Phycisphaerae bacterium]
MRRGWSGAVAVVLGAVWALLAPAGCVTVNIGAGAVAGTVSPTAYAHGAVAADHEAASRAGADMLRAGGNAVDAAVAASFTLSVVRPYSCGIGGGGFMVIHLPADPRHGRVETALNYREVAPGAVGPDFFEREANRGSSVRGGKAVAVPGTVAGLLLALERYGTLDRRVVLGPAIRAAEEGFVADAHYESAAAELIGKFELNPEWKERFPLVWGRFLDGGRVRAGCRVRLPEQARALRLIAEGGASAFYEGPVGEAVIEAARSAGGVLTAEDLRAYRVSEVEPLAFTFRGLRVLTMPPPSSGGVALGQMLGIFEAAWARSGVSAEGGTGAGSSWGVPPSAPQLHRLIEAMKHAFADRAEWLGDPAFATGPVAALLDPVYLGARAAMIEPERTQPPGRYGTREGPAADHGTSHLCAADRWGGAVSCTETINLEFGSLVGVDGFGFCLNNEMDDFTTERDRPNSFGLRQSARNLPAPGKRPLSSMTPTIVLSGERVRVIAGASGGPRIITGTAQVLLNVLLGDTDAAGAVGAPRVHHQWSPDVVRMERGYDRGPGRFAGIEAWRDLTRRGHRLEWADELADVQCILIVGEGAGRRVDAASDPRKGGAPDGH